MFMSVYTTAMVVGAHTILCL